MFDQCVGSYIDGSGNWLRQVEATRTARAVPFVGDRRGLRLSALCRLRCDVVSIVLSLKISSNKYACTRQACLSKAIGLGEYVYRLNTKLWTMNLTMIMTR